MGIFGLVLYINYKSNQSDEIYNLAAQSHVKISQIPEYASMLTIGCINY